MSRRVVPARSDAVECPAVSSRESRSDVFLCFELRVRLPQIPRLSFAAKYTGDEAEDATLVFCRLLALDTDVDGAMIAMTLVTGEPFEFTGIEPDTSRLSI